MKRVLTAGKIVTDPETGRRVLWQTFDLLGTRDGLPYHYREATPFECPPGMSRPMLQRAARRALISQRLRRSA